MTLPFQFSSFYSFWYYLCIVGTECMCEYQQQLLVHNIRVFCYHSEREERKHLEARINRGAVRAESPGYIVSARLMWPVRTGVIQAAQTWSSYVLGDLLQNDKGFRCAKKIRKCYRNSSNPCEAGSNQWFQSFFLKPEELRKRRAGDVGRERSTSEDVKDLFKTFHGASTVPGSLGFLLWLWIGQWSGWLEINRSLDGICSLKSEDDEYREGLANTFSWVASKHA